MSDLVNWAGNHTYRAGEHVRAESVAQVQRVVAGAQRLRVLGTRHSFNAMCDTDGVLLDLAGLTGEPELADDGASVRVAAGTTYAALAPWLHEHGRALANMGSLPHICVGGAAATGTHGSGTGNQVLAAAVRAIELVRPDGTLEVLRRGDADFEGSVVALGTLGVVTALELDCEPTYDVVQQVYEHLGWSEVVEQIGEVLAAAYSVSVFGRWRDDLPTDVLVKTRVGTDAELTWGEPIADDAVFRSLGDGDHVTRRGEPGPWSERLPHFRADRQPSFGQEIQSEWFVALADAVPALRAVTELAAGDPELVDLLSVTELRAVRGDDLWLSPAHGRDTLAIHFTWRLEPERVAACAERVADALAPYAARAHWGKVPGRQREPGTAYPRLDDFRALRARVDPDGTLLNAHVAQALGL
ncbi:FAD-binding protein [Nocardioides aequoreus]|uniref:FAD-binding protein n=1 Tax=Nocardioides aequoreus TaxID=397278 RepID=UPI0004C305BD|nr:FAD-binding protein [Nocardioides aequoreus]